MEIRLLNSYSSIEDVWKISRPYLHEQDIPSEVEITKMNLPVNQFKRYTLYSKSSILFRDLLFTFRPITVWARSNRTIKFNEYNLKLAKDEALVAGGPLLVESQTRKLNKVINAVQAGEKQDYAKKKLPWFTETEFCIDIDQRQLVNIVYTFEEHEPTFFELLYESLESIIDNWNEIYDNAIKVDLYPKIALSKDELVYGEVHRIEGDMHFIKTKIKGNLQAQFIRQHSSTIKNGLWNLVNNKGKGDNAFKVYDGDCELDIDIAIYILSSQLKNLCSTRTCWFAQMDKEDNGSWSYVLKDYIKEMTTAQFMKQLPCGGKCCNCKIEGDMIPRVKHTEVNPPCPILIENPFIIDQRLKEYKSDSEIMMKWKEAKKFIRYNPNNELNKIYSELQMEGGTNVHVEDK